ncbi:MAG: DUF3078 domain-containing protein, partial [Flavobacteriaceae bacterium]|nr:DUF3078 domain-containing protein [Flavobacteriaceae bacterium]
MFLFLFISSLLFSQTESDSIQTPVKWNKSGTALFLANQSSFSNWTSGGQSSISGTIKINYNFNYYKKG